MTVVWTAILLAVSFGPEQSWPSWDVPSSLPCSICCRMQEITHFSGLVTIHEVQGSSKLWKVGLENFILHIEFS